MTGSSGLFSGHGFPIIRGARERLQDFLADS
jgi:hypothetical protein